MQATDILQSLFRWIHILAGIVWIGHLYFFNFVNGPFLATLDAETKKKVVPELAPRALFWFRYGALFTWVTGFLLLLLVFYHGGLMFNDTMQGWTIGSIVSVLLVFVSPFVYDAIMKMEPMKKNQMPTAAVSFVLIALVTAVMIYWGHLSYRAYNIHIGSLFGTIMAWNVWFRIWPAQQKIINGIKNGTPADASVVALAGMRSKQNTYMSVPLIWLMINGHTTWAAINPVVTLVVILVGWHTTSMLYKRAGKVKGF